MSPHVSQRAVHRPLLVCEAGVLPLTDKSDVQENRLAIGGGRCTCVLAEKASIVSKAVKSISALATWITGVSGVVSQSMNASSRARALSGALPKHGRRKPLM